MTSGILIVYDEHDVDSGQKGLRSTAAEAVRKVGELNEAAFRQNMLRLCSCINHVLEGAENSVSHFSLDSVELSIEVKASGEIRFIGSVGAETSGGLKLKFKKK